jgi:hypothetical protein
VKNILMIGTVHEFQEDDQRNSWRSEFREMLSSVVANYRIEIILEEWSAKRGKAIGETLATEDLKWHSVATPSDAPEYSTYAPRINFEPDPSRPGYLSLPQYPFEIQEKREQFMVERTMEYISTYERGLLIVGMNHLHSLTAKLRARQCDVTCGIWSQFCGRGTEVI